MIIFEPERSTIGDRVRVSARVELEVPPKGTPTEIFFDFPLAWTNWVSDAADAFVMALLLPAMQRGEDVEVRSPVSPRLALGLEEYQRAFHAWFPWRFRRVVVRFREGPGAALSVPGGLVATAFSGGVDSFYTLWSHLPQNDANPRSAVSAGVFVHGFDVPLEMEDAYRAALAAYRTVFAELGLELVPARTNAQDFTPPGNWGVFHGAALAAVAHALGRGISRFYVPASHTYTDLVPWGSDPRVDHLLSSETLQIVHDGASATRVDKTVAIGRWPATFGRLRVCHPRADGALLNCGRCEKCVRTMVVLEMLGALPSQTSFPERLERRHVRGCSYRVASDFAFPREIIAHARSVGRWDRVAELSWAMARSRTVLWVRRTVRWPRRAVLRVRRAWSSRQSGQAEGAPSPRG